jgi:hypothetical protein
LTADGAAIHPIFGWIVDAIASAMLLVLILVLAVTGHDLAVLGVVLS